MRASSLAGVVRVDVAPAPGVELGASVYAGNTTGGRPSPDMEGRFAPVVIADAHATVDVAPFSARAVALWGHLDDAALISEKNRRLSNNLGVLRSPVAEQALAAWGELGVGIAPSLGLRAAHRLEPFVRLERYDTMLEAGDHTFDNPRFSRTVYGAGVAYTLADASVATIAATHRRFGSDELRAETTAELGLGFVY